MKKSKQKSLSGLVVLGVLWGAHLSLTWYAPAEGPPPEHQAVIAQGHHRTRVSIAQFAYDIGTAAGSREPDEPTIPLEHYPQY